MNNVTITQVLKYENQYFEVGEIVKLKVDSYASQSIIGKLIEFSISELKGNNNIRFNAIGNIKIDISDKFKSDIRNIDISNIVEIERIEI